MFNKIKSPELYHGNRKNGSYFEGWYFKHSSKKENCNFSIIPGVSIEEDDKHAFIQVIIGPEYRSYYLKYDFKEFEFSDEPFLVKIGKNRFSKQGIFLDIDEPDIKLNGEVSYINMSPIDKSILQPSIMGFFGYFKFMQCNHGVISLNHFLSGEINYNGKNIDFSEGKGYMEKDWGTSFPKKYIWIQCNNFRESENSLFLSVAHIPFLGLEFMGMIGILKVEGKQYRFATYNRSKLKKLVFSGDLISLEIDKGKLKLKLEATLKDGRVLKAPKNGMMIDKIKETLEGEITAELLYNNKLIYKGESKCAGIERVNFESIIT